MLTFLEQIKDYANDSDFGRERVLAALEFVAKHYEDSEMDIRPPLDVLNKLIPLKPDEDTIIATLLHDIYLNSSLNDEELKSLFGQPVVNLLNSFKKLSALNYKENSKASQIEVLRKMFLAMAKDIRVILIWLAVRLNLLEQLGKSTDKLYRERIARETMMLYVPIASRLGIYIMKVELEDLSFKYLEPANYARISKQIEKFGEKRKTAIAKIQQDLKKFLLDSGVSAEVGGRVKSVYSIYQKLFRKNLNSVDQLHDFFAIRVVVPQNGDTLDNLYAVLGLIHSEWKPVSSRFKDYVAVPKPNGYRSLHTVVLGLGPRNLDHPVEIQIRDEQMNKEAEFGIAAHWLYKTGKNNGKNLNTQVDWIKGLEKLDDFFFTSSDSIKEASLDLFRDRIFVLTPRGEVKDLTAGATPIDFAYMIHTDVGNHCVMAKVNDALVPLDSELRNGDVVEIITKKEASPKLKWLSMVKSNFAKHKIKVWFSALNKSNNLREGRRLINIQLERIGQPLLDHTYSIFKTYCGKKLSVVDRESLLEEVGRGLKVPSDVVKKVYPYDRPIVDNIPVPRKKTAQIEDEVVVAGESGLPVKYASCCKPGVQDQIVGYVTRGNRVTIHKATCRLLDALDGDRIMIAGWSKEDENVEPKKQVGIVVKSVSRIGMIQDIASIISGLGINIADVRIVPTAEPGMYNNCFLLQIGEMEKFELMVAKLKKIKGVLSVTRTKRFLSTN